MWGFQIQFFVEKHGAKNHFHRGGKIKDDISGTIDIILIVILIQNYQWDGKSYMQFKQSAIHVSTTSSFFDINSTVLDKDDKTN